MDTSRFREIVADVETLTALLGAPSPIAIKKQRAALDRHMSAFLAESPFVLLGTVGTDGRCDVSPRGDAPGIAQVLDPRTLILPERPGNRRADSLRNIVETGRIGLLFMVPGRGESLRVNGAACVLRDEALLAPFAVAGKTPTVGIAVEIEECFLQCAKALIRSRLWESAGDAAPSALPCFAQILHDQTQIEGQSVEDLERLIADSYANRLY